MKNTFFGIIACILFSFSTIVNAENVQLKNGWALEHKLHGEVGAVVVISKETKAGDKFFMVWDYMSDVIKSSRFTNSSQSVTYGLLKEDSDPVVWFIDAKVDGESLQYAQQCFNEQKSDNPQIVCIRGGAIFVPAGSKDAKPLTKGHTLELVYQTANSVEQNEFHRQKISLKGSHNAIMEFYNYSKLYRNQLDSFLNNN